MLHRFVRIDVFLRASSLIDKTPWQARICRFKSCLVHIRLTYLLLYNIFFGIENFSYFENVNVINFSAGL